MARYNSSVMFPQRCIMANRKRKDMTRQAIVILSIYISIYI